MSSEDSLSQEFMARLAQKQDETKLRIKLRMLALLRTFIKIISFCALPPSLLLTIEGSEKCHLEDMGGTSSLMFKFVFKFFV